MPIVISENGQTRCRNSYQSSAQCRLTLRVNGEDAAAVITDSGEVVQAGFDAPTDTPVATQGGAGNVPVGYYVYRYVYASSRYPFVENAVTGGGDQWPRSSPSPASNTLNVATSASIVTVTGAYTMRSDVDSIWMYRTSVQTTAALAEAQSNAGRLFYVGRITNQTAGGSFTYTDNVQADTAEPLELDNYTCPLFRQTVFDGFQWWGWGNRTLAVVVQLNDTDTITTGIAPYGGSWGNGRNGSPGSIAFVGITTGGYDGRGNFYFQNIDSTTAHVYNSADMITPVVLSATGLTTAYLSAPATTLYKSKQLNPFSWGVTQVTFIPNTNPQQTQSTPFLYAEQIGGGVGTAISLVPNERVLKLDTESPERSYALDLNAANSSDFIGTLRTLDDAQSVGSQFSQFPMRNSEGQSLGAGINAKALQIVQGDAQSQIPIGGPVVVTLRQMVRTNDIPTFFHGVYDRNTELNCWWVKIDASEDNTIDTLIYQHAPTGTWGLRHSPGTEASWTVYDPTTEEYYTFMGADTGIIGAAFNTGTYLDNIPSVFTKALLSVSVDEGTALVIPIIATVGNIVPTSNPTIVTVNLDSSDSGLQTGDYIQITATGTSVSGFAYSIFNVTASSFQVQLPFALAAPQSGGAVIPAVAFLPSVVSQAGFGMVYVDTPDLLDGTVVNTDVVFFAPPYTLRGIYDNSTVAGPLPDGQYDFWIGGIPCFLRRYFNASTPEQQKQTGEIYITALNTSASPAVADNLLAKFYANYDDSAVASRIIGMQPNFNQDETPSAMFYTKNAPSDLTPSIGVEILQISNTAYELMDLTIKQQPS